VQINKNLRVGALSGAQDFKLFNARSKLGHYWITAGLLIRIVAIGLVFSLVFESDRADYIGYIAISLVVWTFLNGGLRDGAASLVSGASLAKALSLAPFASVVRSLVKNQIGFLQNFAIVAVVFSPLVIPSITWSALLLPLSFVSVSFFILSFARLVSPLVARYRDLDSLIANSLGVALFVTPVLWQPERIPADLAHLILGLNPLYHPLQVLRQPLLGEFPTLTNWFLVLGGAVFMWSAGTLLLKYLGPRIPYWI